ncbi:hypothetical protein E2562_031392 [Oryza meyeriana var. granulata]|uniref:Uncharacterized protein n=1 Tax=Oryza meyeriana var. granulata TaxID=110450 RepID=A0A6G1BZR5_9ORYZ|nr:hypothetical protein E2562_031392 [Oryza meyeriana var. granulata]
MDHQAAAATAPTIYTYGILIDCYCRAYRPDLGLSIFGHLLRTGLGLNVYVYNTLIDDFSREGEVDRAYNLFQDMIHHRIEPNVVTCNSIMNGLCITKTMDKADSVVQKMVDATIIRMMLKKSNVAKAGAKLNIHFHEKSGLWDSHLNGICMLLGKVKPLLPPHPTPALIED